MNKVLNQVLLCTTIAAGVFAGCKKDDPPPATVTIADSGVEQVLRKKLNIAAGQAITVNDMNRLDSLNLDAETDMSGALQAISNLGGLEHATNLVYLHIGYTKVTSLAPIKDLKKMSYLRVNNTAVADLSPIAAYTTLTYFNANTAASITDISALARNTSLKELILRSVPFGNAGMTTIRNFTSLYRINIRSTGVTDISVLAELMSKGALLDTTPEAAAAGGATLDLRGLTGIDCSLLAPYKARISTIEGC